jgi:hypothetical protein
MAQRKKTSKETSKRVNVSSQESESYFVSAKNPLELRRQLLESTKKTVLSMQNFQRLQMVREQKLQELSNLRQSIKELIYLNKKFNEKLPRYDNELLHEYKRVTKESQKVVAAALPHIKQVKNIERTIAREKSDMEKLEESLAAIEKKLQTLNK